MHQLVLLATSNEADYRGLVDKRLQGYATIQLVEAIRGGIFLAYDEQIYELEAGNWFFPAQQEFQRRIQQILEVSIPDRVLGFFRHD